MKALSKIIILSAAIAMAPISVSAGIFDSAVTSGWPTKQDVKKYKVDVYGFDVRVYEWTPEDNEDVRCVFVAGNQNSSGVACYEVEESKKENQNSK